MPIYDLLCKKCGIEFNKMAKIREREENLIKCPSCGCADLSAVYKSVNFIIKQKDRPVCPNMERCGGCAV